MTISFKSRDRSQAIGPGICFLLLIAAGWIPPLWLTGPPLIDVVDTEPFLHMVQGDYLQATPSLLYSAFMGALYGIGAAVSTATGLAATPATTTAVTTTPAGAVGVDSPTSLAIIAPGFEYGIAVFALVQSLILIFICAGACSWLYTRGAPLWLCLIVAVTIALFAPFSHLTVQPNEGVLVVACLLPLTIKLINALRDNCAGLRRFSSVCSLLALLSILLFLDSALVIVVIPTLLALCLTPTRVRGRLSVCALVTVALCSILLLVFFWLGWMDDPFVSLKSAFTAGNLVDVSSLLAPAGLAMFAALVITIGALVWVLMNRRSRYLLPFIPLLAFGMLCLLSGPQHGRELGLSIGAFVFCLHF
jgi:hypothetical protein